MSLVKTYQVGCEGVSLASRLGMTKSGPGVLFHNHQPITLNRSGSAAKIRRQAIKDGWTRPTLAMPILDSSPDAGSTNIAFDLCPSCSKMIGERHAG